MEMVRHISSTDILPSLLQHAKEDKLLAIVPASTDALLVNCLDLQCELPRTDKLLAIVPETNNVLLLIRLDLQNKTSKNSKDHAQKPWRNSSPERRRGILAPIESVPNISGDVGVVGEM
ncbi:hypothetical protein OIU84_001200 [Salix udensis]|uniref:Uncharacterized protein n=1 Tax=Salix udensis TaxID=889485 RepID=A0AAD6K6A4_9ROSI|nr:hypothetical protein OIU84_001200 [Salix udensis]